MPENTLHDLLDPRDVDDVLRGTFYRAEAEPPKTRPKRKAKADHYEVICISLYNEDLARLDDKVAELKAKGHRKMTRSALIRFALDHVDVARVPRSY